jgi:hypothetical protein
MDVEKKATRKNARKEMKYNLREKANARSQRDLIKLKTRFDQFEWEILLCRSLGRN